jgi:hypothetical protein
VSPHNFRTALLGQTSIFGPPTLPAVLLKDRGRQRHQREGVREYAARELAGPVLVQRGNGSEPLVGATQEVPTLTVQGEPRVVVIEGFGGTPGAVS